MKRMFKCFVVLSVCFAVAGCGGKADKTAKGLLTSLQEKIPTINKIVEYTADTDPNKLLGKEGEYKEKADFFDSELTDNSIYVDENTNGGTLEVFNNQNDLEKRRDYIQNVYETYPKTEEYMFSYETVILRINPQYPLEKAIKYADEFSSIVGEEYTSKSEKDLRFILEDLTNELYDSITSGGEEKEEKEDKTDQEPITVTKSVQFIKNGYKEYNGNYRKDVIINDSKMYKYFYLDGDNSYFEVGDDTGISTTYFYNYGYGGMNYCNYDYKTDSPKEGSKCSQSEIDNAKQVKIIFDKELKDLGLTIEDLNK